jgi:magnesium transporter
VRLATLLGPELRALIAESPGELKELLQDVHPDDIADGIVDLEPNEIAAVLAALPARQGAPILEQLSDHEQLAVAAHLPLEKLVHIVGALSAGRRSHLVRTLPEDLARTVTEMLEERAPEAAAEISAMRQWKPGSAASLMSTSFVTILPRNTVADAVAAVRAHDERTHEAIDDVYVVEDGGRIAGKIALRELVFAAPSRAVAEIYRRKVISVAPDDDQREVGRRMAKHDLHVVPVVDDAGVLLGMVSIDDVIDALTKETTQAVQRIGAVEPLDMPYFKTRFRTFIRKRGVWLVVLFFEEFFTQTALRYYDPVFEAIKGASYYVPLLISTGGNSGSQSSTLVIRGLAVGEVRLRDWWRILYRELGMGLALGTGLGAIGFLRVLMYRDQHLDFAVTIAFTLVGIVTTGCTVGAMLPLVLRRLGIDPATSSTPFIASLVDVLGIIVFVQVAKIAMASVIAAHSIH